MLGSAKIRVKFEHGNIRVALGRLGRADDRVSEGLNLRDCVRIALGRLGGVDVRVSDGLNCRGHVGQP